MKEDGTSTPWPLSVASFLCTLCILGSTGLCQIARAEEAKAGQAIAPPAAPTPAQKQDFGKEAPKEKEKDPSERNFYEVLSDLLGDFEYDLTNGNVSGVKDIALRNIALSENVPTSFKNHLELLITEKILKTVKTRVIQCLPCRARKTSLNGDQVVISSPETNPVELARIAKAANISNFLDVAFSYQPNSLVLSMYIMDPETDAIIWSRSYNSENSIAGAYRRGVDYSQIDEARKRTEYSPIMQGRLILSYSIVPSLPTAVGCLSLGYRLVERYDNRKKEVGFEAYYLTDASTIINSAGANPLSLYNAFGLNLTLLFLHSWNLIGEEENYNKIRGTITLGVGGTYASGYLGALVRAGYEFRLGKHYAVSLNLGYRPTSTAFFAGTASGSVTGFEYGLGINYLF